MSPRETGGFMAGRTSASPLVGVARGHDCRRHGSGRSERSAGSKGSIDADRRPAPACSDGEDGGEDGQGGQGRGRQAADDGAPQGRRLLAPLAPAQGHGDHAGDHGATRHEDRPEPSPRPRQGGRAPARLLACDVPFGERHQQDRVGHGHADRHDRPHERLEVDGRSGQPERDDDAGHDRRGGGHDHERQANRLEVGRQQEQDDDDGHAQAEAPARGASPSSARSGRGPRRWTPPEAGPHAAMARSIWPATRPRSSPATFAVRLTTRFML